jgi:hypothetical protein
MTKTGISGTKTMMHKILRVKLHQQPHKVHIHQMTQAEEHHTHKLPPFH